MKTITAIRRQSNPDNPRMFSETFEELDDNDTQSDDPEIRGLSDGRTYPEAVLFFAAPQLLDKADARGDDEVWYSAHSAAAHLAENSREWVDLLLRAADGEDVAADVREFLLHDNLKPWYEDRLKNKNGK